MRLLFHPFWANFTSIITLLFIILFPPAIINKLGATATIIYSLICIAVFWVIYFVWAVLHTKASLKEKKPAKN